MVALVQDTAPTVLEIRNLEKRFGTVEVLTSINLDMAAGEFLVLVGPSGCGKTTLLNCIAGLEDASGGRILIGGRDVTGVPPRDRDIAMVFQSYALYPSMNVAENIAFGMKVRHVPKSEQEKRLREVAALLQIDHLLRRKPGALSGGQRQRVAMGRALVREPVLFLFDEPLSNLDAKLRVELRGEIKQLHERLGASIVYVTHDQIEAMTLGSRIVVLNSGVIQQNGTPEEVYERPANLFVADFMGSPPMNLVHAGLGFMQGGAVLNFTSGERLNLVNPPEALLAHIGKSVVFGIRPESLTLSEVAMPGRALPLAAQLVEHSGADTFVSFSLGGETIMARLAGRAGIIRGQTINVIPDLSQACYFDPATELRIV